MCSYSVTSLSDCRASQHATLKICHNTKTAALIDMSCFIRILCSLATSVIQILRVGICEYAEGW